MTLTDTYAYAATSSNGINAYRDVGASIIGTSYTYRLLLFAKAEKLSARKLRVYLKAAIGTLNGSVWQEGTVRWSASVNGQDCGGGAPWIGSWTGGGSYGGRQYTAMYILGEGYADIECPAGAVSRTFEIAAQASYTGPDGYHPYGSPHGGSVWTLSGSVTAEGPFGSPSTVEAPDGVFGEAMAITLYRELPGALHTVTVSCAGRTETVMSMSGDYPVCTWTPCIADYAPLITDTGSAEATFTCETFYDGMSAGTSERTVTLSFPDGSIDPVLLPGAVTLEPYNTGGAAGFTGYIQGVSAAQAVFDPEKADMSGTYGAELAGYAVGFDGLLVTEAPYRTPVLTHSTEVVCSVIDSRGKRGSVSFPVEVMEYAPPVIRAAEIFRCNALGEPQEDGERISIRAASLCSSLNGQNSVMLRASWKLAGSTGGFSAPVSLISNTAHVPEAYFSPDRSYIIRIEAEDGLGTVTVYTETVTTRQWAMKFRSDARGVAFGKAPEHERALELPSDWTLMLGDSTLTELIAAALPDTEGLIAAAGQAFLLAAHPVGSYYISEDGTDPGTLFGGTWERVTDRFLLAAGELYPAGSSGGSASQHLTVAELPANIGSFHALSWSSETASGAFMKSQVFTDRTAPGGGDFGTADYTLSGGGQYFSIMPPYEAVYVYKRIA